MTDVDAVVRRLEQNDVPLFKSLAERSYRADTVERGQREFLVQNPDGYLLRFAQPLGERPSMTDVLPGERR